MRVAVEIARLQVTESFRRQQFAIPLFVAVLMLGLPAYVNAFSMGIDAFSLVTKNFALGILGFYGATLGLALGASVVRRDLKQKVIYPLLSRPMLRLEYVTGHMLGLAWSCACSLGLAFLALQAGMYALQPVLDPGLLGAFFSILLQSVVLAAAALCFSMFSSPPLAGILAFAMYVVGSLSRAFIEFFLVQDRGAAHLAWGVTQAQKVLPRFELFNLNYQVEHGIPIDPRYFGGEALYALGWIAAFAIGAALLFERKDL